MTATSPHTLPALKNWWYFLKCIWLEVHSGWSIWLVILAHFLPLVLPHLNIIHTVYCLHLTSLAAHILLVIIAIVSQPCHCPDGYLIHHTWFYNIICLKRRFSGSRAACVTVSADLSSLVQSLVLLVPFCSVLDLVTEILSPHTVQSNVQQINKDSKLN